MRPQFASTAPAPATAEPQQIDTATYVRISDLETLNAWVARASAAGLVAFDTETDSLVIPVARLVGFSFAVSEGEGVYVPVRSPDPSAHLDTAAALAILKPLLEDPAVRKTGHNLKYDCAVLANHGVELRGIDGDTMIASWLVDPTRPSHGLDATSEHVLGVRPIPIEAVIGARGDGRGAEAVQVPAGAQGGGKVCRRAMRLGDADITLADGRSIPRPADVQDTASQFVELGHRFATGRQALALGEVVTLWLARPGGVDAWTYDVVAQDLLQIPRLGEVPAWRLRPRPLPQRRDNLSAEIWFAPSLQYLPVRIRLALGDEAEIDLKVETIEQR
jgi:hypothetical protein